MSERSDRYYKQGERDGRNNDYRPPHNDPLSRIFQTQQERRDREDYNQGNRHGHKQQK